MLLPDPPVTLTTIRPMVETIVTNLVNNAIRYNRDGGRVSVRLVDTGKLVRLAVEDEGIGIPADEQAQIFDEFYRTPTAREKSNLGTGLGLADRQEVRGGTGRDHRTGKHRGNQGSTFTVVLPREVQDESAESSLRT